MKTPLFELLLSFCNDDVIVCASVCWLVCVCVCRTGREMRWLVVYHTRSGSFRALFNVITLFSLLSLSPLSLSLSLISHSARLAPLSYRSLIFALCPVSLACYFSFFPLFNALVRSGLFVDHRFIGLET